MGFRRFEDILGWQMGRELTREVYAITREGAVSRDFGFIDQIRRAAVSIMNNIAEGYERGSNRDFAKFLFIARGSAGEVRSMLYVALDHEYIDQPTFDRLHKDCAKCSRTIWGLIKAIKSKPNWQEAPV
ncbi:MAG: four helix bundle protein [Verrucomicrobia bacterium]|jgi:four helix bundle protein|nr:four helix bundle protein [Verrucomicrobiota bacterium]